MTTSQFARMPLYNPPHPTQCFPSPCLEEGEGEGEGGEELWQQRHHSTPHALQPHALHDSWDNFGEECVITNGHPMSPLSSSTVSRHSVGWGWVALCVGVVVQVDSDGDQPDTPGVYRTQSFDLSVFDIRKVPPEQIAVSGVE